MNKPPTYGFLLKIALISCLLIGLPTDTSAQWESLYFDNPNFPELNALAFTTVQNGMAGGDNGIILRTSDSGLRWDNVLTEANGFNFIDVQFTNSTTAFFIGQENTISNCDGSGVIARTKNYGATWEFTYTNENLFDCHFIDDNNGFTVGSCGALYKTVDGGDNWQLVNTGIQEGLLSVRFLDSQNGFVIGADLATNLFLKTSDGGENWTEINLPTVSKYKDIRFLNANIGFVLTEDKIFKTIDGGNDWTEEIDLPFISNGGYENMFWINENSGWVSSTSTVYRTDNGGNDWMFQTADTPPNAFTSGIKDLFFIDEDYGFIAGAQGYFKTTTGGEVLPDLQYLAGNVFLDINQNCNLDATDAGLQNWIVEIAGATDTYYATTDYNGDYFTLLPLGAYEVQLAFPNKNWTNSCQLIYEIDLTAPFDTLVRNLPAKEAINNCPVLEVDLSTPVLTHCANNTYTVRYLNTGTTTAVAPFVEITLDENLTMVSTNWSSVSGNVYTFDIGNIPVGASGTFTFVAYLDCNPIVGQTHTVKANIYPDGFCIPASPLWDGASLHVESICEGDSVVFTIRNNGAGDMGTVQGFVIIEEHVLMTAGDVDLDSGEDTTIVLYPQGTTLRLEVEQVPNHPGRSKPSATYEACTTDSNGDISIGYVNQYPEDDANVFVSIDAQESTINISAPLKRAYPKGYGDEHYIEANVDLDYHILFENNTTDTVYTVIVQDTLSAWFDAASIRQGAASHAYDFTLSGNGMAQFTFTDIQLAPGEKGFIKFRVQQLSDNPIGTYIENTACISFDYGLNNKTNTTFHEVNADFLEIASSIQLSGNIINENGEPVALVEVWNNGQTTIQTDDFGDYNIDSLAAVSAYTIVPQKNINLTNGVDVADLYLIQQHIIGNVLLDSPYKLVAADVNNTGLITMMDIIAAQEVILLLEDEFQGNSSWRFVAEPYVFANATNPFSTIFPEGFTLNAPLQNNEINFTGIKIGDVDNSHNPLELMDEAAEDKEKSALYMEEVQLEKGLQYEVPVFIEGADQLAALQFALQLNETAITFEGVETDATTICRSDNFGYRFLRAGVITACWFDQNAFESNQPNQSSPTMLFRLRFTAQQDGPLSNFITLSPEHVDGLAYERKGDLQSKELKRKLTYLQFNAPGQSPTNVRPLALEIFPNPISDTDLWIRFSLATESHVNITIHNTLGQPIESILFKERRSKGTYTYKWDASGLPEGSYFIQLHTDAAAPIISSLIKVN